MAGQDNHRVIFELSPESCFDRDKLELYGRHTGPIIETNIRHGSNHLFHCQTPTFCPGKAVINSRGYLAVGCDLGHYYQINLPIGLGIEDMLSKMMISLVVLWEQYRRHLLYYKDPLFGIFGEVIVFSGQDFINRPAFGGFQLTAYNGSDTTKARLYLALPDNSPKCFSEFADWALANYMIKLVELERRHKEDFKRLTIV